MRLVADPLAVGAAANGETVLGGEPDLSATYAAVRTATWLAAGWELPHPVATSVYVLRLRQADGGYAPAPGMRSQLGATYHAGAVLRDAGRAVPDPAGTVSWLAGLREDGGFGMAAGQAPDVWATYYGCRVATEMCGIAVPRESLAQWLARLQTPAGGLTWSPEVAASRAPGGEPDVRACRYGVGAWLAAAGEDPYAPWKLDALVDWLLDRQHPDGGFVPDEHAETPCLSATYHAVEALAVLGVAPRDVERCLQWILERRGPCGSFVRWAGYDVEDVWAAHDAIGALRRLGYPVQRFRETVLRRLGTTACRGGGFTYRDGPAAADALSTAGTLLVGAGPAARARAWLEGLQLPNEGGIMCMPGGVAEIRATLWAVCAGALREAGRRARAARWLVARQNVDGGFGAWLGRASDLASTVGALELDERIGTEEAAVDRGRALAYLLRRGPSPEGGEATAVGVPLREVLLAARGMLLCGMPRDAVRGWATHALTAHAVAGGYAEEPGGLPDLLTSYEVAVSAPWLGLAVDAPGLLYTLDSLRRPDGYAWSPTAAEASGPLAYTLGRLLEEALVEDLQLALPPLYLD